VSENKITKSIKLKLNLTIGDLGVIYDTILTTMNSNISYTKESRVQIGKKFQDAFGSCGVKILDNTPAASTTILSSKFKINLTVMDLIIIKDVLFKTQDVSLYYTKEARMIIYNTLRDALKTCSVKIVKDTSN